MPDAPRARAGNPPPVRAVRHPADFPIGRALAVRTVRRLPWDLARGGLGLAAGVAAALLVFHYGPVDPELDRPLAAAGVGSSVGFGFLVGVGAWLDRLRRRADRLRQDAVAGVRALLAALARRDGPTAAHCTRVARVAELIAEKRGDLSAGRRRDLRLACLLHDIGKLWVPLPILRKTGNLTDDEWRHLRAHSVAGSCLARSAVSLPRRVYRIIRQHHERIDGRGYPDGLRGSEILVEARIVAVADALDAMLTDRPYRPGLPLPQALAELRRSSGQGPEAENQFDPSVVAALGACTDAVERLYRRNRTSLAVPL